MTLEEAFSIKGREVVSLVGGGGKTTLMFALGKELSPRRKGIILTTTTKIWAPSPSPHYGFFLSDKISEMKKWIEKNLRRHPYLVIARERLESGKLQGIDSSMVDEIFSIPGVSVIVVEADGAAGRSLKAPREGEPVVPQSSSLLVPVVGIDVLGCPLDEQHVFRAQIASRLLNRPIGSKVTEKIIASLFAIMIHDRPEGARIIPFINKVDLPDGLEKAKNLAQVLLNLRNIGTERVILGQVQHSLPVKEILLR